MKKYLFDSFTISILDKSFDGILSVLFQHKSSEYQFIVFGCYLPPEDSPWGRDSDAFYGHLLGQIYLHNYVDNYYVCGDLNGRIGSSNDFNPATDNIPVRRVIDETKNKHGESLIDFLLECKMSVVNG